MANTTKSSVFSVQTYTGRHTLISVLRTLVLSEHTGLVVHNGEMPTPSAKLPTHTGTGIDTT